MGGLWVRISLMLGRGGWGCAWITLYGAREHVSVSAPAPACSNPSSRARRGDRLFLVQLFSFAHMQGMEYGQLSQGHPRLSM
ncbi:hypothetical protein P171DRAFT_60913 [Karstenula rhodostoma CBS 690.94]|uniref:Secreted protein n=1 Tax=Karstenula rhodostoma CBS 690.94 TaxID=1392251 RepID=A0A9P4PEW9_9PLEO|nr:hypothetical protein P171DRAFT_60913 [Karstenula rhodostoma CBS 690.94]